MKSEFFTDILEGSTNILIVRRVFDRFRQGYGTNKLRPCFHVSDLEPEKNFLCLPGHPGRRRVDLFGQRVRALGRLTSLNSFEHWLLASALLDSRLVLGLFFNQRPLCARSENLHRQTKAYP